MTFQSRYYGYGITEEGVKEFLHTFLNEKNVVEYLEDHRKLFGSRYKDYCYTTMSQGSEEVYLK